MTTMTERMDAYYAARAEQDARAEAATGGYATELAAYYGTDGEGDGVERRITLKEWLVQNRAEREPEVTEMSLAVDEAMTTVDDTLLTEDELFRMTGATLALWVEVGSARAAAEIQRRALRRAAKRAARVSA